MVCRYSCRVCGLDDAEFTVPERAPNEDLVTWMRRRMSVAVWQDHLRRSPACLAKTITDLKIPLDGREHIGGPVVH